MIMAGARGDGLGNERDGLAEYLDFVLGELRGCLVEDGLCPLGRRQIRFTVNIQNRAKHTVAKATPLSPPRHALIRSSAIILGVPSQIFSTSPSRIILPHPRPINP